LARIRPSARSASTFGRRWDGSAWTLKDPGQPSGATQSALASASCPTTTSCIAVGYWVNGSGTDIILAAQYS
jgi:hypothetical protein